VLIPPKSNRIIQREIIQREYDKAPCIRSVILLKDYSNKLKNYPQDSNALRQNSRGIYGVFIHLASILIWLNDMSTVPISPAFLSQ
jgi:hypothetical protein